MKIIYCTTILLLLSGCIVFPYERTFIPPLRGRVINGATGKPIGDARIIIITKISKRTEFQQKKNSDINGFFTTNEIKQKFFLTYIGSPGCYPSPYCYHETQMIFVVIKDDFKTCKKEISGRDIFENPHANNKEIILYLYPNNE